MKKLPEEERGQYTGIRHVINGSAETTKILNVNEYEHKYSLELVVNSSKQILRFENGKADVYQETADKTLLNFYDPKKLKQESIRYAKEFKDLLLDKKNKTCLDKHFYDLIKYL